MHIITLNRLRSPPVGTRLLGEVFSGFLLICKDALGPQGPRISFGRHYLFLHLCFNVFLLEYIGFVYY